MTIRRATSWRVALVGLLILLGLSGCATVARVTNLDLPECRESLGIALASILTAEGESAEEAERLARAAAESPDLAANGPRPFLLAAPSGTDYSFFVERTKTSCLLRLYGRQQGFTTYTNNLTYIQTRELPGCRCAGPGPTPPSS